MKPANSNRREPPENSPADRARTAEMPRNNRSRLGNGSLLPAGVDGRSSPARRWKEVFSNAMRRAGNRSEQLARSYASAVVAREALDARIASGQDIDVPLLVKLSGEVRRLSARLDLAGDPAILPHNAPPWLVGQREGRAP